MRAGTTAAMELRAKKPHSGEPRARGEQLIAHVFAEEHARWYTVRVEARSAHYLREYRGI
jgi:hypothetical protein